MGTGERGGAGCRRSRFGRGVPSSLRRCSLASMRLVSDPPVGCGVRAARACACRSRVATSSCLARFAAWQNWACQREILLRGTAHLPGGCERPEDAEEILALKRSSHLLALAEVCLNVPKLLLRLDDPISNLLQLLLGDRGESEHLACVAVILVLEVRLQRSPDGSDLLEHGLGGGLHVGEVDCGGQATTGDLTNIPRFALEGLASSSRKPSTWGKWVETTRSRKCSRFCPLDDLVSTSFRTSVVLQGE